MKKITKLFSIVLISVMLLTSCTGLTDILFPPDYKQITNDIFTKYIEMNVMVEAKSGTGDTNYKSQGSGVIYGEDSKYYYCLTNAHVVDKDAELGSVTYTITDCYGKEYSGALIHSDRSRDLAVVRFTRGAESLCVVKLAESDPVINQNIAVISTSNHLMNAVTFGKVKDYKNVDIFDDVGNDDTRVTFPVIWHNAPMWDGASGSVLLNMDMELVGINYAVATNSNGQFVYAFAVSVSHVRTYLEENNLMI